MDVRATKGGEGNSGETDKFLVRAPSVSLPKGGGAIRGMGEKFTANPVTGTGSMSVPIVTSPGRSGFGPQLSLSYDSGAGNGPFGFGWNLSLPQIARKTDKGLPKYRDGVDEARDSDIFILSGAEDLVPVFKEKIPLNRQDRWVRDAKGNPIVQEDSRMVDGSNYRVRRYRPRIEGLFALIERWIKEDSTEVFWRSISKDNITTWYGKDSESRVADPSNPSRVFSWLICESHDDKGNVIVYRYRSEDGENVDLSQAHERNRGDKGDESRTANRYLGRICYGNRTPYLPELRTSQPWPKPPNTDGGHTARWMFEVLFDYHQDSISTPLLNAEGEVVTATIAPSKVWEARKDPFSSYRAGFEVRTYRLCQRVLMFHHFEGEDNVGVNCLVRSTDFTYSKDKTPDSERNAVFSFLCSVSQSGYQRQGAIAQNRYLTKSLPPVEFEYTLPNIDSRVHEVAPESLENLPYGLDGGNYQWIDLEGEGLSGVLTEQADSWFYKRNLSPIHLVRENDVERAQATLAPIELVASKPNASITAGAAQFMDLAGDGQLDLVMLDGPTPGFYEHDGESSWEPFRAFMARLNRNTRDPNLRFIDLDGDGHADVLITEDEAFAWHPSLGEDGFGPAERVSKARDEEQGPALVFADGTQSIYLADMSGDGLTDLVRIRNGEVSYWPNLGYGQFGAKVTMDNSPWFDAPEQFDQRRIQLADIDGSGVTDIVYLHGDGVRIYFNQSGNGWQSAHPLTGFPPIHNAAVVTVVDLLGNGTACLVWSSPLPNDVRRCMRYIDLMGGQKPHLLIKMRNNLGAETEVNYAPSTKFYLQDKLAGRPWITRLPFPVHVVERTTITDKWRKTTFSSTYSYHHGYFDGVEREFRGFGRVEQIDVENFHTFAAGNKESLYITNDFTLYQPPVKTITWFHTGAAINRERILTQFEREYFPNSLAARPATISFDTLFSEKALPEPVLASDLNADEWREALRACKGMTLRQEVYELEVDSLLASRDKPPTEKPVRLFSAANHNCNIRCLQPKGANQHAVFLVTESEAINYHYELDLRPPAPLPGATTSPPLEPDPRVAHTLNLLFDDYGNVQQSIAIGYPRWGQFDDSSVIGDVDTQEHGDLIREIQAEQHVAYTETHYTEDAIDRPVAPAPVQYYRLPVPCEVQTYELTGFIPEGDRYFELSDFVEYQLSGKLQPNATRIESILYHQLPEDTSRTKRLVEHGRSLFFQDDLSGSLELGKLGRLGLPYEQYKLALTDELLDAVFLDGQLDREVPAIGIPRDALKTWTASGYLSGTDADTLFGVSAAGEHWMRSGVPGFEPDADEHFYLPEKYTDPFNNVTTLTYDDKYDLFVVSSKDALGNTSGIFVPSLADGPRFDYRVLAPKEMVDVNGNRSEVYFDVLGMVIAAAVKGKGTDADNLDDYNDVLANPDLPTVLSYFDLPSLTGSQAGARFSSILGDATARFIYHFGEKIVGGEREWMDRPAGACGIVREQHAATLTPATSPGPLQISFECSDGMGTVLMKRSQAEPAQAGGDLRWIVSGKTVLNNKGKPVKQYEPYFTNSNKCCAESHEHEEVGFTPIMYYDAVGRLVRTEMPDGTFSRVEFSPWFVRGFDANDTVLEPECSWYREKGRDRFDPTAQLPLVISGLGTPPTPEERAGWLAAQHANTPAETHLDSLGREVIAIAHNRTNGVNERYLTFTKLDAEGKPLWIRDARGNLVMQYITPYKANDEPSNDMPYRMDTVTNNRIYSAPSYDIAGNLLFQHSMDAGDRWMLMDATGKPMFAWDRNEQQIGAALVLQDRFYFTKYDKLHRLVEQWLSIDDGFAEMVERFEYQDAQPNDVDNLNGQAVLHFDPSGRVELIRRDFKGNALEARRRLNNKPTASLIDWQGANPSANLESDTFRQLTEYDALNRMTLHFNWHRTSLDKPAAKYEPRYNERGLLVSEEVTTRLKVGTTGIVDEPKTKTSTAIIEVRYNAKGQKELIILGNGTFTRYDYDEKTFRLRQLRTTALSAGQTDPAFPEFSSDLNDGRILQQLHYFYDSVGNIAEIYDEAYEPVFFQNQRVESRSQYEYDSLYRLTNATGRENGALYGAPTAPEAGSITTSFPIQGTSSNALRKYTQTFGYDKVGNIDRIHHDAGAGTWTRRFHYADDSNRLLATWDTDDSWATVNQAIVTPYSFDTHGNTLNLQKTDPRFNLRWDHRDMIGSIDLGGGGQIHYQYDTGKQRTRKHIEAEITNPDGSKSWVRRWERIYLGGYELYRRYTGDGTTLVEEIESHHLFEGAQRVLLVDDVLISSKNTPNTRPDGSTVGEQTLFRYQYSNHLGSACLELDDQAKIISYEEYHPYGTSAYRAMKDGIEAPPKRYRYTGMERDEESGLSYHTARYYAPWVGRWLSCDPAGLAGSINSYGFAAENPINHVDLDGAAAVPVEAVALMDEVVNRLTGTTQHLDRGSNQALLLEAQGGGIVKMDVGRYYTHIGNARADAGRARALSDQIRTYIGQTAGLSEDVANDLRFATARLEAAAATTETTIAAAELLHDSPIWATRFEGQTFKAGQLISEQLGEMAAAHGAPATLLPESTLFEGVLDRIGDLARRGGNAPGINFYSGVPFIQEFFESAAWEKIANQGESAIRWASVKIAGAAEVAAKLARFVQFGLAIHGGESAVKSLISPEKNQRLNVYFTTRDLPGEVEQTLFQGAATLIGLVDAAAVDVKAGVGDWDYGAYAADVYMAKGMSPAQRDFTEWARVEFGIVPDRR